MTDSYPPSSLPVLPTTQPHPLQFTPISPRLSLAHPNLSKPPHPPLLPLSKRQNRPIAHRKINTTLIRLLSSRPIPPPLQHTIARRRTLRPQRRRDSESKVCVICWESGETFICVLVPVEEGLADDFVGFGGDD